MPVTANTELRIIGIGGLPEVREGDDLAALIGDALVASDLPPEPGDIVVVTHKIVSKAEGQIVDLTTVAPSPLASQFGARWGKDPRKLELVLRETRRIVRMASEDIGMADPSALQVAVAAASALELIGMPEARLNLAQATIHLALAPKSNAVLAAIETALADVRAGRTGSVPQHLRDSHYPGAAKLGVGGYRYPHDFPGRVVAQQYAPDPVVGREYYSPSGLGVERVASQRLAGLREVLRGDRGVVPEDAADGFRPRCRPAPPTKDELAAHVSSPPDKQDDDKEQPSC